MAIPSDSELAAIMQRLHPRAPIERIVHEEWPATAINAGTGRLDLTKGERVVRLACGHTTITRAHRRAACYDCHRMMLNGEDYEGFRNRR